MHITNPYFLYRHTCIIPRMLEPTIRRLLQQVSVIVSTVIDNL